MFSFDMFFHFLNFLVFFHYQIIIIILCVGKPQGFFSLSKCLLFLITFFSHPHFNTHIQTNIQVLILSPFTLCFQFQLQLRHQVCNIFSHVFLFCSCINYHHIMLFVRCKLLRVTFANSLNIYNKRCGGS